VAVGLERAHPELLGDAKRLGQDGGLSAP
jgi:hypothetical protein